MKRGRQAFRSGRHEQRFEGLEHDPYKAARKPAGPARCRGCGATYRQGRWTWEPAGIEGDCEAQEVRTHPLQRIIALRPVGEGLLVTTTDSHLARRIGEALVKSYKGSADYRYAAEENLLRVTWRR